MTGAYGAKPTLKFPPGQPAGGLHEKVLKRGTGPAVTKGSLLVADYLGQIWHGKVFDNSYDRKQPLAAPIGVGQLIKGWDDSLVGVPAGSRVLLVVPPAEGYGSKGQPAAGIKKTDTLTFVIDVVRTYTHSDEGDVHATPQHASTGGVAVTGALGKQPTVTVAKQAKVPTKPTTVVLDRGHAAPLTAGIAILRFYVVDWTGKLLQSSWTSNLPSGEPVGNAQQPSVLDSLVGVPIGSRVLIEVPPQSGSSAADVVVTDIVGQAQTAAQAASG